MAMIGSPEDGPLEIVPEVEEEFRSCCCEDEQWQDTEECLVGFSSSSEDEDADDEVSSDEDDVEVAVRMFFKGVSVSEDSGSGSKASGIGVIVETSAGDPILQVQKKLDFFMDELVAEHLALLDGLIWAQQNGVQRIVAFTDSEEVHRQIGEAVPHETRLMVALGYRILELADEFESFVLKLVCRSELNKPLKLAQEAVGILHGSVDECLMCCCEERQESQIIKLKCSHSFCVDCMVMHVQDKLQVSQVPLKCPLIRCKHYISNNEVKPFLPVTCYQSLERATTEANILNGRISCPFPNCSVLLSSRHYTPSWASSSDDSDINCVECQECRRLVCSRCGVPWHSSMSCNEYQSLPAVERDVGEDMFLSLARNNNWRLCQQCSRMIELTEDCYHVRCRCGHEFCYSCGAGYHNGAQTCQCAFWEDRDDDDDDDSGPSTPSNYATDQWRWEAFNLLPSVTDGYSEQERAQLALIQRFLAGGFGLNDDQHHLLNQCQSPPRCADSYLDAIKDLHQLPWLERFVSVISDSYHEEYIQ